MHSDDTPALMSKEDQWSDLCDRVGAPEIDKPLDISSPHSPFLSGDRVYVRMAVNLIGIDAGTGVINTTMAVPTLRIMNDDMVRVGCVIYRHALDAAGDVIRSARFVCVDRRGDPVTLEADEIGPGDSLGEVVERALLHGHGAPREERDRMLREMLLEIQTHRAAQLAQVALTPAKKPSMMERVTRRMQRMKGCYATVVKGRA